MRNRPYRVPEDMLPFADKLSVEEQKKWVSEWRRLVWHSPRYVAAFSFVAVGCITFFALFMPAWEFTTEVWSRWLFGLMELGVAYTLADWAAFALSKRQIEGRISESLRQQERA